MPPGAFLRWGSWIYLALALAAIVWLGLRWGTIPQALFWEPASWWSDLAIGIGAAASLLAIWHVGLRFLVSARVLENSIREAIGPLTASEVVTLAVLSGFAEELFFRGAVQSEFGIAPATILFALLHIGPGREYRLWTLFALLSGCVLGLLMLWRGNLLAPVAAHVAVNLFGLARLQRAQ